MNPKKPTQPESRTISAENLLSISQVAERCPALSQSALRWLVYNSKESGFDEALIFVGRRVFIDFERLNEFLEKRRGIR